MKPAINSEIGVLKTVLVHRPGIEIGRITPDNKEALLFDDLLWLERAQDEHDAFVGLMTDRGTEVLYLDQLLYDVMGQLDVRLGVLESVLTRTQCGPAVSEALVAALMEAPARHVVDVLVGGIMERELGAWGIDPVFADLVADRFHHVLSPLPNLLFMRDNASWIGSNLSRNVLATPARHRESVYVAAIYDHHPLFLGQPTRSVFGASRGDVYPASLEGGDVLVLNDLTVCLGIGERTTPAAVEILARRLFDETDVEQVIAVHLPHARALMHLDTALTMVDRSTFNVFPGLLTGTAVHVVRANGEGGLSVVAAPSLEAALLDALGLSSVTLLPTGGDAIGRLREQWDDGNNTLALAPGVVVAYSRNVETNARLREHGVEVLELDSSELCRGRGGSRCMTQPIVRAPLGQ
ncbi:Arginine deiminase [hydrothermal vent metagenome]|uniref:Arginine deiminase n=1 Tax=hydrothermal vent metagenome TaxID=652676 RepID=A0A3B0S9Q3_9ZZZZ